MPHSRRSGSVRWLVLAFLVLVLGGAAGLIWIRSTNFEQPDYVANAATDSASLSGRAIDTDGRPVGGLKLDWYQAEGDHEGGLIFGGRMFGAIGDSTITETDGTFRFEGLQPNDGYVSVSHSDPLREGATGQFDVRLGFEASGLELVVEEVAMDRRLPLRIVYGDGSPAVGLLVSAEGRSARGSWSATRVTSTSGEAEFVAQSGDSKCRLTIMSKSGAEIDLGEVAVNGHEVVCEIPR